MFLVITGTVFLITFIDCRFWTKLQQPNSPSLVVSITSKCFLHYLFLQKTASQNASTSDPVVALNISAQLPNRIVGGTDATPGEFPFMVSIQLKGKRYHVCGGTLINWDKVLTACHCLADEPPSKFTLKDTYLYVLHAGTVDILSNEGQRRFPRLFLLHPSCTPKQKTSWRFDVGIVITTEPFREMPGSVELLPVTDATVPDIDELAELNFECTAVGWGATSFDDEWVAFLKKVKLRVISDHQCTRMIQAVKEAEPTVNFLYEKVIHLCTIAYPGHDACKGDSGGPLICGRAAIATVTWGLGCGEERTPSLWTRLDVCLDWIMTVAPQHSVNVARCDCLIIAAILISQLLANPKN